MEKTFSFYFLSSPSPFKLCLPIFFFLLTQITSFHAQTTTLKKPPVPAVIVFGDSIVDPGNNNKLATVIKCDFPPYGRDFVEEKPTGRFCNGRIPSDFIASSLGIKELLPAYLDPNLTPEDLLTGVSFASGGSGYDSLTPKIASVLSLSDQLEMFKEYKEKLKMIAGEEKAASIIKDALYVSIIGTDDLANTYFSTPFRKNEYDVSSYTDLMVKSASSFYQDLYHLGARKIGVVGLPPVGCVPSQRTLGGGITRECVDLRNQAAKSFNSKLAQQLKMLGANLPGSKVIYIDIYTILDNLVRRPADYGFEVSNKGCCGSGKLEVAVLCNPLSPHTCEDVSKYVFWDSYHPTENAYKIITDSVVTGYLHFLL